MQALCEWAKILMSERTGTLIAQLIMAPVISYNSSKSLTSTAQAHEKEIQNQR